MAARGSFQKRKKEAERREKRQLKLDRRQGRQPVGSARPEGTEDQNQEAGLTDDAGTSPLASPVPPLNPSSEESR